MRGEPLVPIFAKSRLQSGSLAGHLGHSGWAPLHWTAAGMLEAEQQFRRVAGQSDLANAVDRDLAGGRFHAGWRMRIAADSGRD